MQSLVWRQRENETNFPSEDGWYRVMISGDSESIDGHTIYAFDDYETWAKFTKNEDGGGSFVGVHDEDEYTIFAYCGPFIFSAYDGDTVIRTMPADLCKDEGCPQHGTPHVCVTLGGAKP